MKKEKYDNEIKDFKKIKRDMFLFKLKHAFNIMPEKQIKVEDSGPDISTITEHIAFVIDDEVVEIMHCQPKLAAILLSEPQIIRIKDGYFPKPGWRYEDSKFIEPAAPQPEITTERDKEAIEHSLPTFEEFRRQVKESSLMTFKDFVAKLKEKNLK